MAQYKLVSVNVHTPIGSTDFATNDVVDVYWDTTSSSIKVKKNGVDYSYTSASQIGDINTNYYVSGITSYEGEYAISGYSFCDETTLNWFKMPTYFPMPPYMERVMTSDSPVCSVAVCDIHFNGAPEITHTTDLLSNNGQIVVSATSSNGTVKYGLTNFDYTTGGQTSGTITGLGPGTYTVYAKDENDCTAQIEVTILFKPAYAEHYRFEWSPVDINGVAQRDERIRIYEREYFGDLVTLDTGASSPFQLNKPKAGDLNDKFVVIHPTNAMLSLIAEVDHQFIPLYTWDDKKYRVVYEVDEGSGFTEAWQGFILPSYHVEPYVASPYAVEIPIADNVKKLEKKLFTDDNGQLINGSLKLIKVIAFIMRQTGLELDIRSGINIFEENHNTAATDDPLDQTYIDVACYRDGTEPFTCAEVLEAILMPFGARILQSDGQWVIEEIDRATAEYSYRVFDYNGDYQSNGTFDPIKDIKSPSLTDRAAFVDRDHTLEVIPSYGKVTVTSQLNYIGSIVAGSFEKEDLLSPESEVTTYFPGIFKSEEGFRDWSLKQLNGISGVSFGRTVLSEDDSAFSHIRDADLATERNQGRSVGAFFFNAGSWEGNLRDAYIESTTRPLQYGPSEELKVSFDYSTLGAEGFPFMVLRFSIKVGTKYLQQDFRTWSETEAILRTYPKPSSKLQTYEGYFKLPGTNGAIVDSTITFRLYYYAADFYDFGMPATDTSNGTDGLTDLRAFPTANINNNYFADIRLHKTINSVTNYYRAVAELRVSTAAEDVDGGIIHPDDFDSLTNPKVWWVVGILLENDKSLDPEGHNPRNRLFYVDNIHLDTFSNGEEAPRVDTINVQMSRYVDEKMEVALYNFDAPDIVNAKNMYNNYFRLSDGTPTSAWTRSGNNESLKLQDILLRVLASNHAAPTFRLTGSFVNEFERINPDNYLRLTKTGSSLSVSNTEFTSDLSGWTQGGSGTSFAWTADNSGSAEVTLTGAVDSKKIYQAITHDGGYIQITGDVAIVADSTNDREDVLWAIFYRGGLIVHTEKVHTFLAPTSDTSINLDHTAFVPGNIDAIGFYVRNVNGTGTCTYRVGKFAPAGTDVQEVFQITDYQADVKHNRYRLELSQLSKSYISLTSVDQGGTNQGGTTSRAHSSGHSSGYN